MEKTTVFFSVSQIKIMTAKHLLTEAGISCHSIDKMDSAHAGVFGDIELHVPKAQEAEARKILEDAEVL